MPTIQLSDIIKQDRKKVYQILKNIDKFPEFMSNVKKSMILERSGNKIITSWEVELDGTIVLWKEEDAFNDKEYKIDFNMLEGDYAQYSGTWQVGEDKNGSRIDLNIIIDYGAPALEEFIGGLLEKKTILTLKGMLLAIKRKAEAIG